MKRFPTPLAERQRQPIMITQFGQCRNSKVAKSRRSGRVGVRQAVFLTIPEIITTMRNATDRADTSERLTAELNYPAQGMADAPIRKGLGDVASWESVPLRLQEPIASISLRHSSHFLGTIGKTIFIGLKRPR
jgi:hypothetical protein